MNCKVDEKRSWAVCLTPQILSNIFGTKGIYIDFGNQQAWLINRSKFNYLSHFKLDLKKNAFKHSWASLSYCYDIVIRSIHEFGNF